MGTDGSKDGLLFVSGTGGDLLLQDQGFLLLVVRDEVFDARLRVEVKVSSEVDASCSKAPGLTSMSTSTAASSKPP